MRQNATSYISPYFNPWDFNYATHDYATGALERINDTQHFWPRPLHDFLPTSRPLEAELFILSILPIKLLAVTQGNRQKLNGSRSQSSAARALQRPGLTRSSFGLSPHGAFFTSAKNCGPLASLLQVCHPARRAGLSARIPAFALESGWLDSAGSAFVARVILRTRARDSIARVYLFWAYVSFFSQ